MNKCVYNVKGIYIILFIFIYFCNIYICIFIYIYISTYILIFNYIYIYVQLAVLHEPFEDVLPVNLCGFPASHVSLPPGFAYDDCIGFSVTPGLVPSIRWGGITFHTYFLGG